MNKPAVWQALKNDLFAGSNAGLELSVEARF
jgi:hypothetical protein